MEDEEAYCLLGVVGVGETDADGPAVEEVIQMVALSKRKEYW